MLRLGGFSGFFSTSQTNVEWLVRRVAEEDRLRLLGATSKVRDEPLAPLHSGVMEDIPRPRD